MFNPFFLFHPLFQKRVHVDYAQHAFFIYVCCSCNYKLFLQNDHYESCKFRLRKSTCPFCMETLLTRSAEKQVTERQLKAISSTCTCISKIVQQYNSQRLECKEQQNLA